MITKKDVFIKALTWALEEFEIRKGNHIEEVFNLIDLDFTSYDLSHEDRWKIELDFNGDYSMTIESDGDAECFAHYIARIFSVLAEESNMKDSFISTMTLLLQLYASMSKEDEDKEWDDLPPDRKEMYGLIQEVARNLLGTRDALISIGYILEGEEIVWGKFEIRWHRGKLIEITDRDPRACAEKAWEARFALGKRAKK